MIQSQSQQSQQPAPPSQQPPQDCRSEATSVCGDNSSVLSGFSGAVGVAPNVTSVTSNNKVNSNDPNSKRDSLVKENLYVDASTAAAVAAAQQQPQQQQQQPQNSHPPKTADDLDTSTDW